MSASYLPPPTSDYGLPLALIRELKAVAVRLHASTSNMALDDADTIFRAIEALGMLGRANALEDAATACVGQVTNTLACVGISEPYIEHAVAKAAVMIGQLQQSNRGFADTINMLFDEIDDLTKHNKIFLEALHAAGTPVPAEARLVEADPSQPPSGNSGASITATQAIDLV
jgi:hypothetical protein